MSQKVAEEVAQAEFDRMCDAGQILREESEFSADELEEWKELRRSFVRDICRGALVIDTEGRPVYTPIGGKRSFTFNRATGATLSALETYPKHKSIDNTIAALMDVTGCNKGDFGRMDARDVQACGRILGLFLNGRASI
jgi:hypothetical protein